MVIICNKPIMQIEHDKSGWKNYDGCCIQNSRIFNQNKKTFLKKLIHEFFLPTDIRRNFLTLIRGLISLWTPLGMLYVLVVFGSGLRVSSLILKQKLYHITWVLKLRLRIIVYSMIALKMQKMQVTIKLSIAFSRLEAAAGAFVLKVIKGLKFYLK